MEITRILRKSMLLGKEEYHIQLVLLGKLVCVLLICVYDMIKFNFIFQIARGNCRFFWFHQANFGRIPNAPRCCFSSSKIYYKTVASGSRKRELFIFFIYSLISYCAIYVSQNVYLHKVQYICVLTFYKLGFHIQKWNYWKLGKDW